MLLLALACEDPYATDIDVHGDDTAGDSGTPTEPVVVVQHCGTVDADETWVAGRHRLTCDVDLRSATLTVLAGAEIRALDGVRIVVGGDDHAATLAVEGTASEPVVFASAEEDAAGR